jgi:hypothetical protein
MELQKLNVKFFVEQPNSLALTEFIEIFHRWIQASEGAYHDVADYSHMHAGPGIVLVSQDAHISIDESGNRRGLLFSQKSRLNGTNQEKLRQVIQAALQNCRSLEAEPGLKGKLRFAANEAVLSVNDRLLAANSEASFEAIQNDVRTVAAQLFGGAAVQMERDGDPRQRLNVHIKASAPLDVTQALENLARH